MPSPPKTVIVTYIGIDGACAAATALLKYPAAEVVISSAQRIGQTLADVCQQRRQPTEVHVCGLGVRGEWESVARPARELQKKGCTVIWYCGRGYLDRDRHAPVCTPAFCDAASNTEAVARHLQLQDEPVARFLMDLARHDPWIENPRGRPPEVDRRWLDLIAASRAEYFKFNDQQRYVATIRKLAARQFDAADGRLVETFGKTGMRHVLEGRSAQMRRLRDLIRRCAEADESVLIMGESGTGKELVANLIHERSCRAAEPLVTINCAMFAGNVGLANSVLFGHVKGAFTGAVANRKGAFVEASGGMLFLDELGELPLEVQAKMLRMLEEMAVTPEGADEAVVNVDVLVIAATNRDLPTMIRRGEFRADLFHRLSTLRIHLPPLRERPEDVDGIVDRTLAQLAKRGYERVLSREDRASLTEYDWPGNIRQLIKVVKRAVYLEMPIADVIDEERRLGSLEVATEPAEPMTFLPKMVEDVRPLEEARNAYASRALALHHGNVHATARALQITDRTLLARLGEGPTERTTRIGKAR